MKNRVGRPRVLDSVHQVCVGLTTEMVASMVQLSEVTGESRSSIVRRGVAMVLADAGVMTPGAERAIQPVPTSKKETHS